MGRFIHLGLLDFVTAGKSYNRRKELGELPDAAARRIRQLLKFVIPTQNNGLGMCEEEDKS